MAVLPVVYNSLQLGVQSLFGTGVPANKKVLGLGTGRIQPKSAGGRVHRSPGEKLGTVAVPPPKQWSELPFEGPILYNAAPYIYCSAIKSVTPTPDGTNGKLWEFAYALENADAKQLYSVEVGNATRAKKMIDAAVVSFEMTMGKDGSGISGNIIGGKRQDDITITASPTKLSPKIALDQSWDVYTANTQAGLDTAVSGGTKFPLPIKAVFSVGDIQKVLYRMNSADTHYAAFVEQPLAPKLAFTCGDDDTDFAQFLATIDTGTPTWFRFLSLGQTIAGATPSQEKIQLDVCAVPVTPETPEEMEGAALNRFDFDTVYDATAGFIFKISVVNQIATL